MVVKVGVPKQHFHRIWNTACPGKSTVRLANEQFLIDIEYDARPSEHLMDVVLNNEERSDILQIIM